ncbi:hypothetical protein DSL72_002612 [Monilinia vaccinii-corymbosi]|uniref:Uncharacterized protein n=1 Tax=Monilinia vaccinii-corymbosi TaxID=61207 RepID=A0A8A3PD04_9HELO|nr:hypothetical protein DSL72_002612 [Monilinia vaccinii-corymbosi]
MRIHKQARANCTHNATAQAGDMPWFLHISPAMMTQATGEPPGTEVPFHFEKVEKSVTFWYPECRLGARSYSRITYAKWLAPHPFQARRQVADKSGKSLGGKWFFGICFGSFGSY